MQKSSCEHTEEHPVSWEEQTEFTGSPESQNPENLKLNSWTCQSVLRLHPQTQELRPLNTFGIELDMKRVCSLRKLCNHLHMLSNSKLSSFLWSNHLSASIIPANQPLLCRLKSPFTPSCFIGFATNFSTVCLIRNETPLLERLWQSSAISVHICSKIQIKKPKSRFRIFPNYKQNMHLVFISQKLKV